MDKAETEDPQQGLSRIFLLGPMWGASGAPPVIQLVSSELCGVGLFQLEWVKQHTPDATPAPTHKTKTGQRTVWLLFHLSLYLMPISPSSIDLCDE